MNETNWKWLLNLVILGLGQAAQGRFSRGLGMFILAIVAGVFTFGIGAVVVLLWSMLDAYEFDRDRIKAEE